MALFQRRRSRTKGGGNEQPPLGLCVAARAVNSLELRFMMDMHRCPDGILGFFAAFEEDESDGELGNILSPRSGDKGETNLQQFMRLAGLTQIPAMDEVHAIKRAALARLEVEWGPKMQAARDLGTDEQMIKDRTMPPELMASDRR